MGVFDTPGMKLRVVKPSMIKTVETRAPDSSQVPVEFYEMGTLIDGFVFTTHWFGRNARHGASLGSNFDIPPSKIVPNCV